MITAKDSQITAPNIQVGAVWFAQNQYWIDPFHPKLTIFENPLKLLCTKTDNFYILDSEKSIFIPSEVMSSKNSKRIVTRKKGGEKKPMLIDSEQAERYYEVMLPWYRANINRWKMLTESITGPIRIEFNFVRKTKRTFDFSNMTQIIQDAMQKAEWIVDDDVFHFLPYPPGRGKPEFIVVPDAPGVILTIV